MWVFILFALVVALLILFLIVSTWQLEKKSNIPGIGLYTSALQGRTLFANCIKYIRQQNITEGFFHFWLGPKFVVVAVDPDAAKFILKHPDVAKSTGIQASKYFKDRFGEDLVFANGDVWKKQRAVVNFAFTTKAYQSYHPTFVDMTNKVVSKIEQAASKGQDVEVVGFMQRFTLDLLGNSVFHYDFGSLDGKFDEYYGHYKNILSNVLIVLLRFVPFLEHVPIPLVKQFHLSVDKLQTLFFKLIDEHRKNKFAHNDMLDHMLAAADDPVTGLSNVELYSNMWIFFIAGHETTAVALTTALYELSEHQDVQEKLYNEICSVIGDRTPDLDLLLQLKYMDCFINENLRLHPPVTVLPTRYTLKDIQYNDQVIPKGVIVGIHFTAVQTHPKHWTDPQKFDPDRFLPENKKGRHNFAFLPFSLGSRMCIGNDFSLNEQRLVLTEMIRKFKILPPKVKHTWNNVSEEMRIGNSSASLKIQFVPRK